MPTQSPWSSAARAGFHAVALVLALVPQAAGAASCDTPAFDPTQPIRPIPGNDGTAPALAAGSFYPHDGEPAGCGCDLAAVVVTDGPKDALVILRGENNGAFVPKPENPVIEIGKNPVGLVSGRFVERRAIELDDLVVVTGKRDGTPGRVALFVPDQTGRYQKLGSDVLVGSAPRAVVTGHFNSDGKLDVAVLSDNSQQQVAVLFGDGEGGFAAENPATIRVASGDVMGWLAAGKFEGNTGADDIAIAHGDAQGNVRVTIARRTQAGAFEVQPPVTIAGHEPYVAAGNFSARTDGLNDLAVAFADVNENGSALILIGGRQPTQARAVANRPKSVAAGDLNEDGNSDLIIATFTATEENIPDGKIAIYRGVAAGTIDLSQKLWETPPSPILPRALVVGTFGRDPVTGVRHHGLAAANAPKLNTISIYVGNGTGAFAAPTGFVTLIRRDAAHFVVADFHTVGGNDPVLDLAYVRPDEDTGEFLLTVLLSNGERTFHEVENPGPRVGRRPLLMAAGRFDDDDTIDLVVVDANPGDSQGRPRFRILVGEGEGKFSRATGVPDVLLEAGEIPVDIATGQFKFVDPGKPSDIAIVSKKGDAGTLRRFFNDGTGHFDLEKIDLGFVPERMVVSNTFTDAGNYDLVVKRANDESFVFFENGGDGTFVRREAFRNPPNDRETSGHFLVSDVNADSFDDIVMIDDDKTIDVFLNTGSGRFGVPTGTHFKNVEALVSLKPSFNPFQATFFLEDFGDGKPGLVGLVKPVGSAAAIVAAKGDGHGSFVDARMDALELKQPSGLDFKLREAETEFSTTDETHSEFTQIEALLDSGIAGRFANAELGNQLPDLGFLSRAEKRRTEADACQSDPEPNPGPDEECTDPEPDCLNPIRCPSPKCIGSCIPPPPCQDPPCSNPPPPMCLAKCLPDCVFTPRDPYCRIVHDAVYLVVYRNTCD